MSVRGFSFFYQIIQLDKIFLSNQKLSLPICVFPACVTGAQIDKLGRGIQQNSFQYFVFSTGSLHEIE